MRLEPIIRMNSLTTGVWRRFGVHVFEGEVTVADMDRLEESGDAWHARNPGQLVELVIIFPSDTRMTMEQRRRMARIIKRWESARTASATVILAQGMVGSLQRSILTGLGMLAPPPHPMKVFGDTASAVGWLTPHAAQLCGPEAEREALLAAVDALCREFRAERDGHLA